MPEFISTYEESRTAGLSHVNAWQKVDISDALENIRLGKGGRFGSLAALGRRAGCEALLAFFQRGSATDFRQWAFVAASIDKILISERLIGDYLVGDLLWGVLSDCEPLVQWYSTSVDEFGSAEMKKKWDDPKAWPFFRYQAYLAFRGDWDRLGERAERILALRDEIKKDKVYLTDHQFYLALARGNVVEMESALRDMVVPARRRKTFDMQNGLTSNLLEQYATLYAKVAWRHGYEVDIDSPWVPRTLMPIQPLEAYPDPLDLKFATT